MFMSPLSFGARRFGTYVSGWRNFFARLMRVNQTIRFLSDDVDRQMLYQSGYDFRLGRIGTTLEMELRSGSGLKGDEIIVRGFPSEDQSPNILCFASVPSPSFSSAALSLLHKTAIFDPPFSTHISFGHDPSMLCLGPRSGSLASNAPVSLSASSINGVEVTELSGYVPFFPPLPLQPHQSPWQHSPDFGGLLVHRDRLFRFYSYFCTMFLALAGSLTLGQPTWSGK